MNTVSVFLPVKNNETTLLQCLSKIREQHIPDYRIEIVIVDSGSTDKSLSIASNYTDKLIQIKPEEFGHGKTRNLATKYCTGNYIAFLNADAIPADAVWLSNLILNLTHKDSVAAVFSQQIPKPNCEIAEAIAIQRIFHNNYHVKTSYQEQKGLYRKNSIFFSTCACAIRKDILIKYPFKDILVGEDQIFGMDILKAGYQIVYEPYSRVYHSHNYSLKQRFKRAYDAGICYEETKDIPGAASFPSYLTSMITASYQINHKLTDSISTGIKVTASAAGLLFGINHHLLPKTIQQKFTMYGKK